MNGTSIATYSPLIFEEGSQRGSGSRSLSACRFSLVFALMIFSFCVAAPAADLSEDKAVQLIKSLPEFQAHAVRHQCAFSDYERMEDRRGFIPDSDMKACRVDVNTVASDRLSHQLVLWQRFMVSSSGEMFVWDRHSGAYITLDQWRSAGQW